MSDAQASSLPDLILEAPEPVWKKIATLLGVRTRKDAIQLVMTNDEAASAVSEIFKGSKSALTQGEEQPRSALTYAPSSKPIAERMYGGGGKAKLRIG